MEVSALAELIPWSGVGLTGVVTLGMVMILTGRLVPKSTVEEMRAERDARLAEMKAARDAEREAGQVRDQQITELLENSRATVQLIDGLRKTAGGEEP
ncbi:hypothetical protein ACWFMI_23310 [Nocardiopsis terrae]|uniref:hypothetical protein n=1 Tax=Streptomyces sp. NPDC057554 TaxID=3350538 RepID=UPI0036BEF557